MTGQLPWLMRQAGPPARVALWWALRARGVDSTSRAAGRSCLVLAPHPDDETLGCGATIMRKRDAGTPVHVVIATDGRRSNRSSTTSPDRLAAIRASEAFAAGEVLGLPSNGLTLLDFEDSCLGQESERLLPVLTDLLEMHWPDDVLVTSASDPHPDHAALGLAARRAVAASGRADVSVLEYPIWQWRSPASWAAGAAGSAEDLAHWRAVLRLRPQLVSTDGYLARKRLALASYQSQTVAPAGDPAWWTLDKRFLANFFRSHELFLPVVASRT